MPRTRTTNFTIVIFGQIVSLYGFSSQNSWIKINLTLFAGCRSKVLSVAPYSAVFSSSKIIALRITIFDAVMCLRFLLYNLQYEKSWSFTLQHVVVQFYLKCFYSRAEFYFWCSSVDDSARREIIILVHLSLRIDSLIVRRFLHPMVLVCV